MFRYTILGKKKQIVKAVNQSGTNKAKMALVEPKYQNITISMVDEISNILELLVTEKDKGNLSEVVYIRTNEGVKSLIDSKAFLEWIASGTLADGTPVEKETQEVWIRFAKLYQSMFLHVRFLGQKVPGSNTTQNSIDRAIVNAMWRAMD